MNTAVRYEHRGATANAQDIYRLLISHGTQPELVTYAKNAVAAASDPAGFKEPLT